MRRLCLYGLLALLPLLTTPACAQYYKNSFRLIGKADGLPTLLSNKVYETSDGFLWLATQNGLARFDGRQFKMFYSFFADTNSLSGNMVNDLVEDKNHCLWVSSFTNGLSVYDLRKGTWKQYKHPTPDANPVYRICDLFRDKEDNIWVGTMGRGLLKFDYRTNSFEQFLLNKNMQTIGNNPDDNTVREIADDSYDKNLLWLACMDGLYRFDKTTGNMTLFENRKQGKKSWKDNCFHTILFSKENTIWLGTWGGGIITFDKSTGSFENFPYHPGNYLQNDLSTNIVLDLYPVSDTSLYVATPDRGLLEWNIHNHHFYPILPAEPITTHETTSYTDNISVTSNGCLWVCGEDLYLKSDLYSRFGAWHKLPRDPKSIHVYDSELMDVLWLPEKHCYWLAANSGEGIMEYDTNFQYLRSIYTSDRGREESRYRSLKKDSHGNIYMQTRDWPFFYRYDSTADQFKPITDIYDFDKNKEPNTRFVFDNKDRLWMVMDSMLLMYDAQHKQTARYNLFPDPWSNLRLPVIRGQLTVNSNNQLWFGTNIGLWCFDIDSKKTEHFYPSGNGSPQSLGDADIACVAQDHAGVLWLAPSSQGIQWFDPIKKKLIKNYHVSIDPNFQASGANYISVAPDGNVWVCTYNGLGVYEHAKNTWEWFDQRDGLVKDYADQPILITSNGKIFLAQYNGFIAFDSRKWIRNEFVPRIKITGVELDGVAMPGTDNNDNLAVELQANQKRIDISYTAIEPFFPGRLKFWYKLDGYDDKWYATSKNTLQYGGLPPGNFTFHLKAQNSDGVWSAELRVPFSVLTPFYKKWWFVPMLSLIALLLIFSVYRYRLTQVLKLQSIRNNISRNLHDDIGSSVSSINMLTAVAKKQIDEQHPVAGLLGHIGQSAQFAGESIDDIVWSINPGNDLATVTFNRIRSYISSLFESVGIEYNIHLPEVSVNEKLDMELRQDIWLICKEAVNNIIKYSGCSHASLDIYWDVKCLRILITDDGTGFDVEKAKARNRSGLRNMQARALKYKGGEFSITSNSSGTKVFCKLPVRHYPKM